MWLRWIFYSVAFAGGMLICFHPTILSGFKRMQADPGDTVLNHYILEHEWPMVRNALESRLAKLRQGAE